SDVCSSELRNPVVQALDQQGPGRFGREVLEAVFVEGPVLYLPGLALVLLHDNARLDIFLAGKAGQIIGVNWAFEAGKSIADQQWLFLPVFFEKMVNINTAPIQHGIAS